MDFLDENWAEKKQKKNDKKTFCVSPVLFILERICKFECEIKNFKNNFVSPVLHYVTGNRRRGRHYAWKHTNDCIVKLWGRVELALCGDVLKITRFQRFNLLTLKMYERVSMNFHGIFESIKKILLNISQIFQTFAISSFRNNHHQFWKLILRSNPNERDHWKFINDFHEFSSLLSHLLLVVVEGKLCLD